MTTADKLRKEIKTEYCPDLCGIEMLKDVCLILLSALEKYGDDLHWRSDGTPDIQLAGPAEAREAIHNALKEML